MTTKTKSNKSRSSKSQFSSLVSRRDLYFSLKTYLLIAGFIASALLAFNSAEFIKDKGAEFSDLTESEVLAVEYDHCVNVPVLVYHHTLPKATAIAKGYQSINTDPEAFKSHITSLKNSGYTIIPLTDLYDALQNKKQLPARSIVITVDDGYVDNYTYLYPILKDKNVKVDLAINPAKVGKTGYMTWDQIKKIKADRLASVYNHSFNHVDYTTLTTTQIKTDLNKSELLLSQNGMMDGYYFVYPKGKYTSTVIQTLKSRNYVMGLSIKGTSQQCKSRIMMLNRTMMGSLGLSSYGVTL